MESTVDSLTRYLTQLPSDLASSPTATAAMRLAEGLDDRNSLTSKAQAAKSFQDLLAELREMAPEQKVADGVDDLSVAREERRGGRRGRRTG
jgi:hypothetical protein